MSYGQTPAPLPPMPVQQKGWFARNWKWFVPTVIVTPILLVALFIGVIFSAIMGVVKSSEPYQHAVSMASNDPRVLLQMGAPITPGWFATGSINADGSAGTANLSIPLNGARRHGRVYLSAVKSAGVWHYKILQVQIDGAEEPINLGEDR